MPPAEEPLISRQQRGVMGDCSRGNETICRVAHRVVFMDRGEIVEDAPTAEFFGKPRSERAQVFLSKILQH